MDLRSGFVYTLVQNMQNNEVKPFGPLTNSYTFVYKVVNRPSRAEKKDKTVKMMFTHQLYTVLL